MKITRLLKDNRGNAIVEFAVAAIAVFLMGVGAVDFGRMFYDAVTSASAAMAGGYYGTHSFLAVGNMEAVREAAEADLQNVPEATAAARTICDCPDNPGVFTVNCKEDLCANYGLSRLYVHTRTKKTFETIVDYPGIPAATSIDLSNYIRVR